MARCKDCVHYDVCKIIQYPSLFGLTGDGCDHRKNKADVVELTDETIMYTKDKWLVINIESERLGEAIKHCLDCLTEDARRDNNG
jgi:hypothetical protein